MRLAMGTVDSPDIDACAGVSGFDGVHADSPNSTGEIFTFAMGDFLSKMGSICDLLNRSIQDKHIQRYFYAQ
jgi:hypothetical protein